MGHKNAEQCCRYGTNGLATRGYDCVVIPGAEKVGGAHADSRICGRSEGLITQNAPATVCCNTII